MATRIIVGDALEVLRTLPDASHQCCVTSPPYFGLRDYGVEGQIGLEDTPDAYVDRLVEVFREVRRRLHDTGTLWLNMGDSYAGSWGAQSKRVTPAQAGWKNSITNQPKMARTGGKARFGDAKPKDLLMMPERLVLALQSDGWWIRDKIVWHKPNPMPSSVRDRFCPAWEPVFLLSKSARYFFDRAAAREARVQDEDANGFRGGSYVGGQPGPRAVTGNKRIARSGNKARTLHAAAVGDLRGGAIAQGFPWEDTDGLRTMRNVWTIATEPFKEAHFATFPAALAERCIRIGSRTGDTVLDPFGGAGTTGLVAGNLGRSATLIELNPEYAALARRRIGLFAEVA